MSKGRVIICVDGGVATGFADRNAAFEIIDYDNIRQGDKPVELDKRMAAFARAMGLGDDEGKFWREA